MATPRRSRNAPRSRVATRDAGRAQPQQPLLKTTDHGRAVSVDPDAFAPAQRGGGWGPFAESFLRMNREAFDALALTPRVSPSESGVRVSLEPAGRAGAIPLRSAVTGHAVAGLLVEPRFGWSGVGRVLSQTGWHAGPDFLEGPLVPGSGREVPPWVLAGPVLARLGDLLATLRRGYRLAEDTLRMPRGQIVWNRYVASSLPRGRWTDLPCRYPDLGVDPRLRRILRWALERVRGDLMRVGAHDAMARMLIATSDALLLRVHDVVPLIPTVEEVRRMSRRDRILDAALARGVEALGWVVEERGLGGGREMDGLAWALPLERLWEHYVEALVRREAALVGGQVRVGRRGETVFPVEWSDPSNRSLGHLVPDIVVFRAHEVHVIDAKYKAHLAELDEHGWRHFTDDAREAHRADIHQVLAYAGLFAAESVRATLVYPLRARTYEALRDRGRDLASADLVHGARRIRLELRGVPFGG